MWDKTWLFRARSVPKVKKVKILGWVNYRDGATCTRIGDWSAALMKEDWVRCPNLDNEIEVPE